VLSTFLACVGPWVSSPALYKKKNCHRTHTGHQPKTLPSVALHCQDASSLPCSRRFLPDPEDTGFSRSDQ
jgi:hypothetical protein